MDHEGAAQLALPIGYIDTMRYADGNFAEALIFYTKAIETTNSREELSMLFSNRSATYL
jgi:hypothetical protein